MKSIISPLKHALLLLGVCYTFNTWATSSPKPVPANKPSKAPIEAISKKPVVDTLAREEIHALQTEIDKNRHVVETANLIIQWTSTVFTVFTLVLALASIYTGFQIWGIKKTKDRMATTLAESKMARVEQGIAIDNLTVKFEKEKDIHLKLIFPVIEGEYCFQKGEYIKALWHYKEAKEISPNHPWLKNFNWLLINTGRTTEAIQFLENLLLSNPDDNEAKYYLAHAYRRDNQLDIAEQIIKPVALGSKYPRAVYEYASILMRKNDYENAEKMFIDANRYYLRHSDLFCFLNLSITQTLLNKHVFAKENAMKAQKIIEDDLNRTPDNPHLKLQMGVVMLILEQKDSLKKIKSSIEGGHLPIENAKSAIDKLGKIQKIKPSQMIADAIELLQKYYIDNYNEKYYAA